jgi:hypothetical protein
MDYRNQKATLMDKALFETGLVYGYSNPEKNKIKHVNTHYAGCPRA